VKNKRIKDGFGMVSNTVLRDPNISLYEKAVYAYLSTYANNITNNLFVSISKLSDEMGISQSTAKRHLFTLEKKGIIKRESRGYKTSKLTILLK
jgi:DNA-binding MarR family transcriptional regulator